jgi:glutamate-1-semialdehyde 2,1-aminomutase
MSAITLESSLSTFSRRFAESAALSERGREMIPGGYSRNSFNFGPHAIYVDSGDGAYVTTVDGHRLLDLNNNFTVNVLGHNHPAVLKTLRESIESGVSFGNPVTLEAELAELLIARIPSIEKVQFSCSASESCLSAVRVARAHTGKTKIAKFEGGYHGFTDPLQISVHPDAEQNCGPDEEPRSMPDSGGIPDEDRDNVVVLTQNDREGTERILRQRSKEIACVILELESASGGFVTLDREFVQTLREVTAELGIVLIIDETVTLRTGSEGMQGTYGVTPDLTVMGKMIGGGFPLGAIGGSAEIMDVLESGTVSISGTHHGHKIALAAGIAMMQEMTPEAFDRLNAMAERVTTEMNDWSRSRNSPFIVYGSGMSHLAYAYMREPGTQVRTHRDYWRKVDGTATQICSLELANRGFFPVARGDFSLSLPMTDDDIAAYIATMQEIVSDIER